MPQRRLGLAALLTLICLALYLPGFTSLPPVDRDEARFAQSSRQMLESGDLDDIRFQAEPRYKKPIGIYWLQSASAAIAGQRHIWAYRIPSLIAATGAVLLTFWAGCELFGPVPAFAGALLLAASVLLGVEARQAKTDATLLATVAAAQAILARFYLRGGAPGFDRGAPGTRGQERRLPWPEWAGFWGALGIGVLIKGPIGIMVAGLTMLALSALDRRIRWLAGLRWRPGLILLVAIVAPWLIAIAIISHGAFYSEAVGHDMLGKVAGAQESHGAPPGFYLAILPATFWPGSLFAVLALPWVWRNRNRPSVRFCLAWLIPSWIVFEAVPTKLPNYVLPLYPAIALLAGAALADGALSVARRWRWAVAAVWGLLALALAVAGAALTPVADHRIDGVAIAAAVVLLAAAGLAVRALTKGKPWQAMAAAVAGAGVIYAAVFGRVLPDLRPVWVSGQVAAAAAAATPCQGSPGPLIASGYTEPSLVFLAGTNTVLADGADAAGALIADRCAVAAVEQRQQAAFLQKLAADGGHVRKVGEVDGFNYSRGQPVRITLYRLAATS